MLLLNYCGRQRADETQCLIAAAEPGQSHHDAQDSVAGLTLFEERKC
jgi:hypothetical protein